METTKSLKKFGIGERSENLTHSPGNNAVTELLIQQEHEALYHARKPHIHTRERNITHHVKSTGYASQAINSFRKCRLGLSWSSFTQSRGFKKWEEKELITLIKNKVICSVDFIYPKAFLIKPTTNGNQDEYMPGTLNARKRLIKYWMTTLKVLNTFWELWKTKYLTSLKLRKVKEIESERATANVKLLKICGNWQK
ncbi:hypothetical protein LOAG_17291 [Loa loa]|uniref:DUF5641 domain-containing protein n=1 Tax=Loa loa TaxID=7209 RepID=A0A1S0UJ39_LOALO|nr:hypothetical protein LOAG_17291 [Loa loa]EJD75595.1 hypothetical protein LOAG_17291 [Loa loa]